MGEQKKKFCPPRVVQSPAGEFAFGKSKRELIVNIVVFTMMNIIVIMMMKIIWSPTEPYGALCSPTVVDQKILVYKPPVVDQKFLVYDPSGETCVRV